MKTKNYLIISVITSIIILSLIFFYFEKNTKEKINKIDDMFIATYLDGELSNDIPQKNSDYVFDKAECTNGIKLIWNEENWGFSISEDIRNASCNLYFKVRPIHEYAYTGEEQIFNVIKTGYYKLEVWGAQGGGVTGGYGAYSNGKVYLEKGTKLYLNIGGIGEMTIGGYNGGGDASGGETNRYTNAGAGGGATHIAITSGLLATLESNKDTVLIVAGGGGGSAGWTSNNTVYSNGGAAGGIIGNSGLVSRINGSSGSYTISTGGGQTAGGTGATGIEANGEAGIFGHGGASGTRMYGGGGGGYYGGGGGGASYYISISGAGGSSYIGNSLLQNKTMYCYNCTASTDTDTKTISITCSEETPTENCAKKGNGYAKITLLS